MPNTHVPAAGEAMPAANLNRRLALLGGLSAAAALAAIPMAHAEAPTIAEPAEHPDAELFRLDKELEEAHARMERASKVCRKVGRQCEKLYPPKPPEWKEPAMPEEVRAVFGAMTISDMGHNRPAIYAAWSKEIREQEAANKALQEAYHAKREEIDREGGADAAEEAFNLVRGEEWEVGMRICEVPAHTLEGMTVKLRVSDTLGLEDYGDPNEAFLSIAADIKRLAAAGRKVV